MLPDNDMQKNLVWAGGILYLAGLLFCVFFIAEHDIKMSTVKGFVQDIEDQESWASGGNSLRRLAFMSCAASGILGLILGRGKRFSWNFPMVLLAIYLCWTGASVVWSIDPGATMRRYIVMMFCVVGCIGFTRLLTMEQVLVATIITVFGWLFVGLAAEIAFGSFLPHTGDHRFAGTVHPNLQAANLSMLSIAAFTMAALRPKLSWLFYGIMAFAFLFLLLTKCRTATGVLPVSLMFVWIATQPVKNVALGSLVGFWVFSTLVFAFLVTGFDPIAEYSDVLLLGRGEETGSSLTGRLPLWNQLSGYIVSRPLHGFGFGAFWTPRHIYDIAIGQEWVISEAHSSYVDTTLQTGLIGAILMVAVAVSTLLYAMVSYRRTREPEFMFIIGGVVFCIFRGFTESGLSGPGGFTSPLFLVMSAHAWNAHRRSDMSSSAEDPVSEPNPSYSSGVSHE